jgi:hypothetical protein
MLILVKAYGVMMMEILRRRIIYPRKIAVLILQLPLLLAAVTVVKI